MIEDELDWDCKVFKIYKDENQGLYRMAKITAEVIWNSATKHKRVMMDRAMTMCLIMG